MSTRTSVKLSLVLDLGTTTLAGQLIPENGLPVANASLANPQQEFGADILTRLQRALAGDDGRLQASLVDGLRRLVTELCASAGLSADQIDGAVAAGNPGMSCLLGRLPVAGLLQPPHKSPLPKIINLDARQADLGLAVPLKLFPAVAGFVGGDLLAALLPYAGEPAGTLLIDVGTNGELALRDRQRWWVTSVAAGPAFEGGNIETGMVMGEGAVTKVDLDHDRLQLAVAGGGTPRGLCGSGLVSLTAAALEGEVIDATGRIRSPAEVPTNLAGHLVEHADGWGFCYYRDADRQLTLTQTDVRNLLLAKGALRAGVEVLLARAAMRASEIRRVYLTGALGTALSAATLKRVALLPGPMLDKTRFLPDGVLAGLHYFLQRPDGPRRLEALLRQVQPLPLSGTPAFEKHFLAALEF